MSEAEVVALLGPPYETFRRPDGTAMLSWREEQSLLRDQRMPTGIAHVRFQNGRASTRPFSM
jgi:hypothetical protein